MTSPEPKPYLIGAILCGSRAFLPIQLNGHVAPLVCSSVEYLLRQSIKTIVLLDHEDSVLAPVLVAAYPDTQFARVVIDVTQGVPAILAKMVSVAPDKAKFVITCCDNVYPLREIIDPKILENQEVVVVRDVDKDAAVHLDKWHQPSLLAAKWVTSVDKTKSLTVLATPLLLSKDVISSHSCPPTQDLIEFLNRRKVKPWKRPLAGWRNLNTKDAFLTYWAEIHEARLKERQLRGRGSAVEVLLASAPTLGEPE